MYSLIDNLHRTQLRCSVTLVAKHCFTVEGELLACHQCEQVIFFVKRVTFHHCVCKFRLHIKSYFFDGFRLRLRDLMEPKTFFPKSRSERERCSVLLGGDGENEGEDSGDID